MRRALPLAALAALVLAGAAFADREKIARTPADDAAARAAVLKRSDFGASAVLWKGGAKKPDLSPMPACNGWTPKQSDLVVTGAADAEWTSTGLDLDSQVELLRTPRMVRLDWVRTATAPQVLPCLRSTVTKELGSSGTLVSAARVEVARLATYTALYRVVFDYDTGQTTVRILADTLLVGSGRTELTLTTTAPYASRAAVVPMELRLGRLLAGRISA